MKTVPIGVSNRHIHVTQEHLEILFGKDYTLTIFKELGQPGQYACDERVELVGPKGSFKKVRILGPVRSRTQVEISLSDSFKLGVKAPVRDSGDVTGTPGLTVIGPKGQVELHEGVIVAKRHIHMTPQEAADFDVVDKELVQVKTVDNDRQLTFGNVLVRVRADFALEMHVDMDEANAACLRNGDQVVIIK